LVRYALTGREANVQKAGNTRMPAAVGSYAVAGGAATVEHAIPLSLDAGAYSVVGIPAELLAVQRPVLAPGKKPHVRVTPGRCGAHLTPVEHGGGIAARGGMVTRTFPRLGTGRRPGPIISRPRGR
jgi:hypothetical protein